MCNSCPPLARWSFLVKSHKATRPDLPMDLWSIAMRSVVPHGSRHAILIKLQVLWVLSLHTSQFFLWKSWGGNLSLLRDVALTAPDICLQRAVTTPLSLHHCHRLGFHPQQGAGVGLLNGWELGGSYHCPSTPSSAKKHLGISACSRASEPHLVHASTI